MAAPVARTPPTPASASRPTNPSTGTSTRYAAAAATVSSEASTTTTPPTWSRINPRVEPTHQANQMNHSVSVGRERKESQCGPSTNGIPVGRESRNTMWTDYQRHRQSHNSPGSSRVFYRWHRLFSAPRRFFMPALRRKSFRSFIYVETDSPYPFPIF